MNNPFFVLTNDYELDEIVGLIKNEPLQPQPNEKADPNFLGDRIMSALHHKYGWNVSEVSIPYNWKELDKPIEVTIKYDKGKACRLTLTMAWDY